MMVNLVSLLAGGLRLLRLPLAGSYNSVTFLDLAAILGVLKSSDSGLEMWPFLVSGNVSGLKPIGLDITSGADPSATQASPCVRQPGQARWRAGDRDRG